MQEKRYEILDGLPAYGPMYVPVSQEDIPFFYEGFVVRFYQSNGEVWVANFDKGWTNFCGVYDFPVFKRTVVFAFGQCYIMEDDKQKPLKAFGTGITQAFQTTDNLLIAPEQTDITVIDISSDTFWSSERISWDGFKDIQFSGDCVTGLAYEPTSEEGRWMPFSFNFRENEIAGGSYSSQAIQKPWWKFW